jgi:alkenylglycerophosphocholine hydrolase
LVSKEKEGRVNSLFIVFGLAILDWVIIYKKKANLENWSKPLVMVGLGIWYLANLANPLFTTSFQVFVLLAIIFSLIGDVFLLSKIDNFVAGLGSFLIAHIFYILAMKPQIMDSSAAAYLVLTAIMLLIAGYAIISKIIFSLKESRKHKLVIPVIIYGIVLTVMLFLSLRGLYSPIWTGATGTLLAIGGFLFFLSDFLLAWNRFVEKIPNGKIIVRSLYHFGQIGLVAALLISFNN